MRIRVRIRICGTPCWFWDTLSVPPEDTAREFAQAHIARWNAGRNGRNAWKFGGFIHHLPEGRHG